MKKLTFSHRITVSLPTAANLAGLRDFALLFRKTIRRAPSRWTKTNIYQRADSLFMLKKLCLSLSLCTMILVYPMVGQAPSDSDGKQTRDITQRMKDLLKQHYPKVAVEKDKNGTLSISGLDKDASGQPKPKAKEKKEAQQIVEEFLHKNRPFLDAVLENPTKKSRAGTMAAGAVYTEAVPAQVISELRPVGQIIQDPFIHERQVVTLQQTMNDIPVYGAEVKISVNVESASPAEFTNAAVVKPPVAGVIPSRSSDEALGVARKEHNKLIDANPTLLGEEKRFGGPDSVSIIVLDPHKLGLADGITVVCYKVELGTFVFFINGHTLEIITSYRNLSLDIPIIVFDWNGDPDQIRPDPSVDTDKKLRTPASDDASAVYDNTQISYRYYLDNFQHEGLCISRCADQKSPSKVVLNVRWGKENAFWNGSLKEFFFGVGWAIPRDVVGHEYTHAVVQFTSGLQYLNESGAVNESIADFFGEMIKNTQTWTIGESLPGRSSQSPLRDFEHPDLNDHFNPNKEFDLASNSGQPAHYDNIVNPSKHVMCSRLWLKDNGCVHINSGILNHAFYLMAEGSSKKQLSFTGIGRTKVQQVVYHALVTNMTSVSDLHTTAAALVKSCDTLVNQAKLNFEPQSCISVRAALNEVGLMQ